MSEAVFTLPDVGEGLVEAEIVTWKVAVGERVDLNQPLVDIETAKAVVELPSPYAGTVVTLHGAVGDVIEVDQPLITFEVGDAVTSAPTPLEATVVRGPISEDAVGAGREAVLIGYGVANEDEPVTRQRRRRSGAPTPVAAVVSAAPLVAPRSTPPVRLYAKQHGVDLGSLTGTGRDGHVTRADVDRAMTEPRLASRPTRAVATTSRLAGHELAPWSTGPKEERIAVKGVLRSMADAMTQSAFSVPRAAAWVRVDATRTVQLVASLRSRPAFDGARLSPLAIVAMAVCDAARHFPGINSTFDAANEEVVVRRSVNLGIAANTQRGLVVPNIKDADQLDLVAMAGALTSLVDTARDGTTTPAAMLGTTITITNVGPFGIDGAIPILPPGTAAILCVGQIAKAPWVDQDELCVRDVVEIALAFDHRHVDGALASAVLAHIGQYLHDPAAAIIAG